MGYIISKQTDKNFKVQDPLRVKWEVADLTQRTQENVQHVEEAVCSLEECGGGGGVSGNPWVTEINCV